MAIKCSVRHLEKLQVAPFAPDDSLLTAGNSAGGLGSDRNDPSQCSRSTCIVMNEKGVNLGYGFQHEQFAWGIR